MKINRQEWVTRHNPVITSGDRNSPLSVGNGELAYTADFTGFQNILKGKIPLCTMGQWGWHEFPLSQNRETLYQKLRLTRFENDKHNTGYMCDETSQEALFNDLRINPHRLNLARIFLLFDGNDLSRNPEMIESEISDIHQTLDLWNGILKSRFTYKGNEIKTCVCCDPENDRLFFSLERGELDITKLTPTFAFPYGSPDMDASDWNSPEKHVSTLTCEPDGKYLIKRTLDSCEYFCCIDLSETPGAKITQNANHRFVLASEGSFIRFSISFSQSPVTPKQQNDGFALSQRFWNLFWKEGGAVSLKGSQQAEELERRIILSRYLTTIQCSGSLPPQETGLTANSWYGKFHLEMHLWHSAQFALWGNPEMLDKSLSWYITIAEKAKQRAEEQGYKGLRWPKMTDPSGLDSPSPIGTLLCWQQPHFIYLVELLRTSGYKSPHENKYRELIYQSAEFMADYVTLNQESGYYELLPPLIPAQENHKPSETQNPLFELEYWHWGLKTASEWKKREGKTIPPEWIRIIHSLAPPPESENRDYYLAHQNCPETFGRFATDHPSFLMAHGLLPGERLERNRIKRTLEKTIESWKLKTCWGWDFPVLAMTAARFKKRKEAIDWLLWETQKNHYEKNGHNAQIPKEDLPLYLPGNGSLLLAVALLAGKEGNHLFPEDWEVEIENMKPYPF